MTTTTIASSGGVISQTKVLSPLIIKKLSSVSAMFTTWSFYILTTATILSAAAYTEGFHNKPFLHS